MKAKTDIRKRIVATLVLLSGSLLLDAHEFWLQPAKFIYSRGERLELRFRVGENFIGEPWALRDADSTSRIKTLALHHGNQVTDLIEAVSHTENKVQHILSSEGTHVLTMESRQSFSDLGPEEFNAYLKEDGLDEAYTHRQRTNTLDRNGTELYARFAKTIMQVGPRPDANFKKVVGFPLEILPFQNPYNLKVGDPIKLSVLFKGRPLFGARVKVWNRYQNRTTVQNIYSQQDGTIETHVSNPGMWMVSVVKMEPSRNPTADWESFWATLCFGIGSQ